MSEKKPGFFQRLFKGPAEQPWRDLEAEEREREAETARHQPEEPKPEPDHRPDPERGAEPEPPRTEAAPAPAEAMPPEAQPQPAETTETEPEAPPTEPDEPEEADEDDFSPGPPETDPDYVEDIEDERAEETLPVADTPETDEAPTVPAAPPEPAGEEPPRRQSWFSRLASGLKRSSDQLGGSIADIFTRKKLDDETLEDLEDVLIQADLGIDTATAITETLRRERYDRDVTVGDVRKVLAGEVEKVLVPVAAPLEIDASKAPYIILMIGVNGSGKTTTIGKLAQKFAADGRSVMLAAGDTFRAAAIEQLQIWGERTGAPVVTKPAGSDASGLAYEAVERAQAEKRDILIIDTAGRLQNRDELMSELEKIIRVIKKLAPDAPHSVLLTLDATTGQNALNQVEIFSKRAGVTGLVMTKLDGTARGGILVAIAARFGLPVHFIGVGEGVDDLEPFSAGDFARAIAGDTEA